jgi:hypothetical protein
MSTDVTLHLNHETVNFTTRIRKVWDYQKHIDKDTAYSFVIKSNERDEVTLFLTLDQLGQLETALYTFIASAVDVPEPTVNDLAKSQAESEQGWSLA